jgi:hypothetical protein
MGVSEVTKSVGSVRMEEVHSTSKCAARDSTSTGQTEEMCVNGELATPPECQTTNTPSPIRSDNDLIRKLFVTSSCRQDRDSPLRSCSVLFCRAGRRVCHARFITTHAACCTAAHGVDADAKPASLTIGSCRKLATQASISRRLTR